MIDDTERHPDPTDTATDNEERFRSEAIRKESAQQPPPVWWNGVDCVSCEEQVEPGRLAIGKHTCFDCQSFSEKQNKRNRRF